MIVIESSPYKEVPTASVSSRRTAVAASPSENLFWGVFRSSPTTATIPAAASPFGSKTLIKAGQVLNLHLPHENWQDVTGWRGPLLPGYLELSQPVSSGDKEFWTQQEDNKIPVQNTSADRIVIGASGWQFVWREEQPGYS